MWLCRSAQGAADTRCDQTGSFDNLKVRSLQWRIQDLPDGRGANQNMQN